MIRKSVTPLISEAQVRPADERPRDSRDWNNLVGVELLQSDTEPARVRVY
jgi:hypothetical protein